jgi:peptidyl-prolyl cis-trans isomerase B (cyclophilin B)
MANPIANIELEGGDIIKAKLFPDVAPNTVNNFISLANEGFYDGTQFYIAVDGTMIQGGSPDNTSEGGPGYTIPGEFSSNGFENKLKHLSGVLTMVHDENMADSAGSQFIILCRAIPEYDGKYASFGKVIDGMDIVNSISHMEVDTSRRLCNPQTIRQITVDTWDISYPKPVTDRDKLKEYLKERKEKKDEKIKERENNRSISPKKDEKKPTLITCPCCGKMISNQAIACPGCGQPMNSELKMELNKYNDVSELKGEFQGVYRVGLFGSKTEVYCPRCGSSNCSHYNDRTIIPEKTKTRYTANLNPLHPFTLVNKKEKVVRKERTVDTHYFICNSCGKQFL